MTNNNIFCFCTELEKFYFSPIAIIPYSGINGNFQNLYVFIGLGDDANTVTTSSITPTISSAKNLYKDIIALKKANINDISAIAERIDWTANNHYFAYSDTEYLSERDSNGKLIKKFYVRNKYDQVFKCLWNNVNTANSFNITGIVNNSNTYYTIAHNGGTLNPGQYVTILNSDPDEYNGTYLIINSGLGVANVAYGNSSYMLKTTSAYTANGKIKYAQLTTEEPMYDTGTFDENAIIETSDGYKWKYIYTIDSAAKLKFFDSEWMPVPVALEYPNPDNSAYGYGSIDIINVVDGGDGYPEGSGTAQITIDGDGTGFEAETFVANGTSSISSISVINHGKNYSYANVSVVDPIGFTGNAASIQYTISPIGGHGTNPMRELYTQNIMVSVSFEGTEANNIPSDIIFNQVGLIYNPYEVSNTNYYAESGILTRINTITVSPSVNQYNQGEFVYQTENGYRGRVLSVDNINNTIYVINKDRTPLENYPIIGEESSTNRIVMAVANSSYTQFSGNIFYIENKLLSERSENSIEQVRISIRYSR